jgi:hypothetical protein
VAAGGGSFPPPFVTTAIRDGAPEFQTGFGGQATDHTSEATEMTYRQTHAGVCSGAGRASGRRRTEGQCGGQQSSENAWYGMPVRHEITRLFTALSVWE